jgi:thiosulfate reductase cytochrome b subunit
MATYGSAVRRGLPRVPGGEPWPPAGDAPIPNGDGAGEAVPSLTVQTGSVAAASSAAVTESAPAPAAEPAETAASPSAGAETGGTSSVADGTSSVAGGGGRAIRRGLPRVPGGEPWPPASVIAAPVAPAAPVAAAPAAAPEAATPADEAPEARDLAAAAAAQPSTVAPDGAKPLRRGLPRVAGGEPWPPAGLAPAARAATAGAADAEDAVAAPVEASVDAPTPVETPAKPVETPAKPETPVAASVVPAVPAAAVTPSGVPLSQPLPFTRTVWEGAAARTRPAPKPEPERIGPFTRGQWAGAVVVGGAGLLFAAALAVALVRFLLSTPWGMDFLAAYPGEYHLPEGAPVGFPAWLGWQHFFNVFLMVLIIRTGLQVRTEKRPSVFWSPRSNNRRKISLNLWFHQSLDILWLVNGVIFVVLLFLTGQWMRIVPTSWEVFPNAVSAGLQYVSLDWPTENGWVNYNALQQLAYFVTVFLAAPLAAITGVRMSGVWPKNATGLNKAYPVEWARAVHFPVMLYFVAFIAVHVFLVFATGALRNLNHMYAAQGSTDPDAYADNWTGFWFFAASLVVIAAAWIAARPLVLAPIARLFGKVSGR